MVPKKTSDIKGGIDVFEQRFFKGVYSELKHTSPKFIKITL